MKKFFISCLAIAAIASCAKTEAVYTEGDSEIKLSPVSSMNTKANAFGVIDGTKYPAEEDFNVYAYWANQPAGSDFDAAEALYLENVKFINKGAYWGGETTYYWPKNGSLRFAAYSPASLDMGHVLATDTYTLEDFTYPTTEATKDTYTNNTYDILVAPTSESYTAQTAAEKVSVVFEHALSWITFQLKSTAVANQVFTVKKVTLDGVKTHGGLTADMKEGTKTWVVDGEGQDVTVYTGARYVLESVVEFEDVEKGLMVLPQATTTVTIEFTQNAMEGTPALENQTVTIPLTLESNKPWEAGKHYIYTVTFDLDEILIKTSVEDWEDINVPEVGATATEVENYEELQAAIAAGRDVRLADNINLTSPIRVANSVIETKAVTPVNVTIDLNGKSIIAASTDAIVVDNGASLTIMGDGWVKAATDENSSANAVWVKYGNVTINGGNYYVGKDGASRNDCIYVGAADYVADAANKKSTLTINGGTYDAAAFELDQYWVLNLKNEFAKDSKIIVKGGTFKNFDPSNNLSEGANTNFLADGYGSYELTAGYWTVVKKTDEIRVKSEAALQDAAFHGANAVLAADLAIENYILVTGNLTLNLNDRQLVAEKTDAIVIDNGGSLVVNGRGAVMAATNQTSSANAIWLKHGNVVLNGGYYYVGKDGASRNDCIYVGAADYAADADKKVSTLTINGGTYEAAAFELDQYWVLNLRNEFKAAGSKIIVKGGTFKNFDPANNLSEGANTNFVDKGYKSINNGDGTWTVKAE